MRHDPLRGGGDVVRAGSGHVAEDRDDVFAGLLVELLQLMVDHIAGGDAAAGAVNVEQQRLHLRVLAGGAQRVVDRGHHSRLRREQIRARHVRDQAADGHQEDLVRAMPFDRLLDQLRLLAAAVGDDIRTGSGRQDSGEADHQEHRAGEEQDGEPGDDPEKAAGAGLFRRWRRLRRLGRRTRRRVRGLSGRVWRVHRRTSGDR